MGGEVRGAGVTQGRNTRLGVHIGLVIILLGAPGVVRADPGDVLMSERWQYMAAGIVAGEAPAGCQSCMELTACQIIRDAQAADPWGVVTAGPDRRWHGSQAPREEHLEAVARMLSSGCERYPACKFIGNESDLGYWRRVYPDRILEVSGFCTMAGCSLCIMAQRDEPESLVVSDSHIRRMMK